MNRPLERLARRFVPSTSLLSHNLLFRWIVNASDMLPTMIWREYRKLPPNHLRIRIGVGNRFFSNQIFHLTAAEPFWLYYMSTGAVTLQSTIVDLGCGCGRFAHHLRDFHYQDSRFTGQYIGVDIDPEVLEWCRRHFDQNHFQFLHNAVHASKSYNQAGTGQGSYKIPVADESADFIFSRSLFTHLLEDQLKNYVKESLRVLRLGGYMVMSFFCLDYPPPTYGGRHTFSHRVGNASVESLKVPEAAVAYTEAYMLQIVRDAGFSQAEVTGKDPAIWQSDLVARK